MTQKFSERLIWSVEVLKVKADDNLLEIGCGHGLAVSLICDQLSTGKITAIDRSNKMIEIAKNRNDACMAEGKTAFYTADLNNLALQPGQFNKVFAINVNVFWQKPQRELAVIQHLLAPDGTLYLFYQPPTASKEHHITRLLEAKLPEAGYSISERIAPEGAPVPLFGILAAPI